MVNTIKRGPGFVMFDPVAGRARLMAEALRMEAIRASAAVPEVCGPDIAPSPARGPFRVIDFYRLDGNARRHDGHQRRAAVQRADVFDRMLARAARRHVARDDGSDFDAPLTPGQIATGRRYRDLVERHAAGGLRCASTEVRAVAGGGTGGGFIDAHLAVAREIDQLRARIGDGAGLALRRIRPSERGARGAIANRALVDQVCCGDRDLRQVLSAHGWAINARHLRAATEALATVLDRMQGYDLRRPQNVLDA